MYSVVLMMALSSGAETTAHGGHRHGCCGGEAVAYSCHGGSGCWGSGYGCDGGRHRHHRRHNCDGGGCWGTCHGGGCYGGATCHGGGCRGYTCHGGGCWGTCHGGGCSGYTCHGGGCGGSCHGGAAAPAPAPAPAKPAEKAPMPKTTSPQRGAMPAPATIRVSLPADAKLFVDNQPTSSVFNSRVFASPTLEPGKDYHYTLTGSLVRDGQTVTTTKQVTVRAGEESRVTLEFPVTSVAQK